jgi:hypothetical protein
VALSLKFSIKTCVIFAGNRRTKANAGSKPDLLMSCPDDVIPAAPSPHPNCDANKVRKNKKKQNRAEVENSFLKRKQRAGSKVDGKKTEAKKISRGNPRSYIKLEIYMCVHVRAERQAGRCCLVGLLVACV